MQDWAKRIQKRLGLKLEPIEKHIRNMPEYWVMSPTGIKLFRVGGHSSDHIGMISQPDMYEMDPESSATWRNKE